MDALPVAQPASIEDWDAFFARARQERILENESDWRRKWTPWFNIFSALELERNETKHSRWLAFLLDPNETHELRARFLKSFQQKKFAL